MKGYWPQKWWGWGSPDRSFDLDSRPDFWPFLQKQFQLGEKPICPLPGEEEISLPASRLLPDQLEELSRIVGPENCSVAVDDRLRGSLGKSYQDLIRLRRENVCGWADAVLFPGDEAEIEAILHWAEVNHTAVIPYGGGTSVVGGVEPLPDPSHSAVVCVNLQRMRKIRKLEAGSLLVEVEPGVPGPELEEYLNARGFTLGHSPESFEYSTVGGWIAARSAGQFSSYYGKIEEMVESLRLISPRGILETASFPASATGPDFNQLIAGSEGIFGIISRARLKIHPIPEKNDRRAYLFPQFDQGIRYVKDLLHMECKPSLVRLSDAVETDFAFALFPRPRNPFLAGLIPWFFRWLSLRGIHPSRRALLLLGFEGTPGYVAAGKKVARSLLKKFPAAPLGTTPAHAWYHHRFDNPYLRDRLIDHGLLVDTLETVCEWEQLPRLYHGVKQAIQRTCEKLAFPGLVMAHLSHVYPQGSSLYFILLAQPEPGKELELWGELKKAASDTIVAYGGAISHHHGIGSVHLPWFKQQMDELSLGLLRQLKEYFDPMGILNPGKLLPD